VHAYVSSDCKEACILDLKHSLDIDNRDNSILIIVIIDIDNRYN
jgi:hypothetical protein